MRANTQDRTFIRNGLLFFDICLIMLGGVAGFLVYQEGFANVHAAARDGLAGSCVAVGALAFIWFAYGALRTYSTYAEWSLSISGVVFILMISLINTVVALWRHNRWHVVPEIQFWIDWSAIIVLVGVAGFIVLIVLADPVVRWVSGNRR